MLLRWKRTKGYIKGTVFFDTNNNNSEIEASTQGMPKIGIRLFLRRKVKQRNILDGNSDIEIYKENLIAETRTNEKGEYRFDISGGEYSVSLDIDTLPAGKGVLDQNILIDSIPAKDKNFAVRDISAISIDKGFRKEAFIGETVILNASARDMRGNVLAARLNYTSDSRDADFEDSKFKVRALSFNNKKINVNISSGSVSYDYPIYIKMPDLNSVDKVTLAYKNGIIDYNTKILNLIYCMFDQSKLPNEYRSDMPIKSGTAVMEEIREYLESRDSDEQTVQTARGYLSMSVPKLEREYLSPGGYFMIHYSLKGENAVSSEKSNGNGVPDYVEKIGEAFDNAKKITCDSRGFKTPVFDKSKKNFDVYVYNLKGKYGVTNSINLYNTANRKSRVASCYISIDNSYSAAKGFKKDRNDCMKVTVAHEFFHAVQYAYNVGASSWWKEASATWNEDEIYDGVNDYIQYLGSVFSSPEKSLEENSYGDVIFAKYISEKWGGYRTIRRIWEIQGTGTDSSINSIDRTIKESYRNEDIGTIYNDFTACNFNPPQYYREGELWTVPLAFQNTYQSFPVKVQRSKLNHLAANYQLLKFNNPDKNNTVRIIIEAKDKIKWGFKIQKRRKSDNQCELTEVPLQASGNRMEIVCSKCGGTYSEICLIPANLEKERDNAEYTYTVNVL